MSTQNPRFVLNKELKEKLEDLSKKIKELNQAVENLRISITRAREELKKKTPPTPH